MRSARDNLAVKVPNAGGTTKRIANGKGAVAVSQGKELTYFCKQLLAHEDEQSKQKDACHKSACIRKYVPGCETKSYEDKWRKAKKDIKKQVLGIPRNKGSPEYCNKNCIKHKRQQTYPRDDKGGYSKVLCYKEPNRSNSK